MQAEAAPAPPFPTRRLVGGLVALGALALLLLYAVVSISLPATQVEPFRELPRSDQLVLVLAVYPLKTIYMLLALLAIVLVWKESTPSLVALRWSMICFLLGELACWVNIVAFVEERLWLEYLHSGGMVVSIGFLAWAGLEAVDDQVIHYSAPSRKCAMVGVCHGCVKAGPHPCALERLFRWGLPLVMLLTLMPLTVLILPVAYHTQVFGMPRTLLHSAAMQWYEMRYVPLAGLLLIGVAWGISLRGGRSPDVLAASKILLSAGAGHLGFAFLRLACFDFYRDQLVWFVFWEECTELLLVVAVLLSLWIFRPELVSRWRKVVVANRDQ
jgi:hypothetical protein